MIGREPEGGRFLARPAAAPARPAGRLPGWEQLSRAQRQVFIRSVGEGAAVKVFGLSVLEVALARNRLFEDSLARVRGRVAEFERAVLMADGEG